MRKIILYLHSFNGNALEGKFLFDMFLPKFSILLYDMRGCGNNKSEYVTMGLRESIDLSFVVKEVLNIFTETRFYIWGR